MGREWNEQLTRKLTASIVHALDLPLVGKLLVTDLEDSDQSLIEILSDDETKVIGQFLMRPIPRPDILRYREPVSWSI